MQELNKPDELDEESASDDEAESSEEEEEGVLVVIECHWCGREGAQPGQGRLVPQDQPERPHPRDHPQRIPRVRDIRDPAVPRAALRHD